MAGVLPKRAQKKKWCCAAMIPTANIADVHTHPTAVMIASGFLLSLRKVILVRRRNAMNNPRNGRIVQPMLAMELDGHARPAPLTDPIVG